MSEAQSTRLARAIVTELAAAGVGHVVLAPGSRSAPLAYALHTASQAGWFQLHVRIDERVAGFLALGLANATAGPTAVVTTSGTAVANLHPAVLEAHHAGLALLVLSADRPHEMRATGANQTTDQAGVFGRACRWSGDLPADTPSDARGLQHLRRALTAAQGTRSAEPGPAHLNIAFRDPLAPNTSWQPGGPPPRQLYVAPRPTAQPVHLPAGPRTIVVAGDGATPDARRLAEQGDWPLLAEPSSAARSGANAVPAYRLLLDELGSDVERVVVAGHPTLSRPISDLLASEDVEVIVLAEQGSVWPDVAGRARLVAEAATTDEAATSGPGLEWLQRWQRAGRRAAEVLGRRERLDGLSAARVVAEQVQHDAEQHGMAHLAVGSSMAIRELDLVAPAWHPGVQVVANRGLSGIDGTIATASGWALGHGVGVRALLGDLALLHDAGGMLRGSLEAAPDMQLIVLNDGGGAIFATLEHGHEEHAASFERVFATPQDVDITALARAYGLHAVQVRRISELREALRGPVAGRSLIEVVIDRSQLRTERMQLATAVTEAITTPLPEG